MNDQFQIRQVTFLVYLNLQLRFNNIFLNSHTNLQLNSLNLQDSYQYSTTFIPKMIQIIISSICLFCFLLIRNTWMLAIEQQYYLHYKILTVCTMHHIPDQLSHITLFLNVNCLLTHFIKQ